MERNVKLCKCEGPPTGDDVLFIRWRLADGLVFKQFQENVWTSAYENIWRNCVEMQKKMLGTIDLQKSQILETLRSWALKYGKSKFWLPHCLMYGFDRPIAGNPGGLLTRSRHGGRSKFSWHLSSEWYRWAFDTSFKTIQYLLVDVGGVICFHYYVSTLW